MISPRGDRAVETFPCRQTYLLGIAPHSRFLASVARNSILATDPARSSPSLSRLNPIRTGTFLCWLGSVVSNCNLLQINKNLSPIGDV